MTGVVGTWALLDRVEVKAQAAAAVAKAAVADHEHRHQVHGDAATRPVAQIERRVGAMEQKLDRIWTTLAIMAPEAARQAARVHNQGATP